MDSASGFQWRLLPSGTLTSHGWEGEGFVLVYQSANGDTHLLDLLSAEVLGMLEQGAMDEETLWRRVLKQTGFSTEEFPPEQLHTILRRLEQLDLIERTTL